MRKSSTGAGRDANRAERDCFLSPVYSGHMEGESRDLVVKPPVRLALGAVIIAGLLYVLGQYVASQPQRVRQEVEAKRELTVQGRGEVLALRASPWGAPYGTVRCHVSLTSTLFAPLQTTP